MIIESSGAYLTDTSYVLLSSVAPSTPSVSILTSPISCCQHLGDGGPPQPAYQQLRLILFGDLSSGILYGCTELLNGTLEHITRVAVT